MKGIRVKGLVPHGQDKQGGGLAAERCTSVEGRVCPAEQHRSQLLAGLGTAPVEAGEGNRFVLPKGSPIPGLL